MGTRNGGVARMVDEIPYFCSSAPPAIAEPLLVLLNPKDCISVRTMGPLLN